MDLIGLKTSLQTITGTTIKSGKDMQNITAENVYIYHYNESLTDQEVQDSRNGIAALELELDLLDEDAKESKLEDLTESLGTKSIEIDPYQQLRIAAQFTREGNSTRLRECTRMDKEVRDFAGYQGRCVRSQGTWLPPHGEGRFLRALSHIRPRNRFSREFPIIFCQTV